MTDIISKDIDTVSCRLHFLEAGNPQGRDVILLHGMKFNAASWQELGTLEKLATAGYHPLALESAPHPCYQDQPDAWHAALLEFLGSV